MVTPVLPLLTELSGYITNSYTGEPISYAHIRVTQYFDGIVRYHTDDTKTSGFYKIYGLITKIKTSVQVSCEGYKVNRIKDYPLTESRQRLDIELTPRDLPPPEPPPEPPEPICKIGNRKCFDYDLYECQEDIRGIADWHLIEVNAAECDYPELPPPEPPPPEPPPTPIDWIDDLIEFMREIIKWLGDTIRDAIKGIMDGVKEKIDAIVNALRDWTSTIKESITQAIESIKTFLKNLWEDITTAIKEKIDDFVDTIKEGIRKLRDTIEDTLAELGDAIAKGIKEAIDGLIEFAGERLETIAKIPANLFFSLVRDFFFEEVEEE